MSLIQNALEGLKAVDTSIFPCYDFEYLETRSWYKQVVLYPYNAIYYAVSGILFVVKKIVECALLVIGALVKYLIYVPLNWISGGGMDRLIDHVCPMNLLLGKRQLVFPYGLEKFLAYVLTPRCWRDQDGNMTEELDQICGVIQEQTGVLLEPPQSVEGPMTDLCKNIWAHVKGYGDNDPEDLEERALQAKLEKHYQVVMIEDDDMKASSTFGNHIFVHEELFEKIENTVNQGEIKKINIELPGGAHIRGSFQPLLDDSNKLKEALKIYPVLREAVRSALRQQALSLLFMVAMKILLSILSDKVADRAVDFLTWYLGRQSEHQADIVATYFMAQAGYNPLVAIYYQDFIFKGYGKHFMGDKVLSPFTSEPAINDRKLAIYAAIEKFSPETLKGFKILHAGDLPRESVGVQVYPYSKDHSSLGVRWTLAYADYRA